MKRETATLFCRFFRTLQPMHTGISTSSYGDSQVSSERRLFLPDSFVRLWLVNVEESFFTW